MNEVSIMEFIMIMHKNFFQVQYNHFFHENEILHHILWIHTPKKNGIMEQKHHHILEMAHALHFQAGLPIKFWVEYVQTTSYLINHIPTVKLSIRSPYEMLFSKPPFYLYLQAFGYICYVHNTSKPQDKFAPCSKACVFM